MPTIYIHFGETISKANYRKNDENDSKYDTSETLFIIHFVILNGIANNI